MDDSSGDTDDGSKLYYHLTLLAENNTGYSNLLKLSVAHSSRVTTTSRGWMGSIPTAQQRPDRHNRLLGQRRPTSSPKGDYKGA